ncbi:Tyrocidine synthase 3 [Pseudoalteromonas sp. P1-13-1a]|uniref:AMP-binding protein n=1 Tax=Pseudoalteromonas undina TaxID=43660 RepID=A0ACC6QZA3_9GAMM|nr:AMP-binding protein [Pseudoalteromonas sp. P1-13-1a]KPZ60672.1 Tyrocidine synthase 3 [Pseudoalteromonas sp. P1-13-1a]
MKWPTNKTYFYCQKHDFSIWQQQVHAHAELYTARDEQTWLLFDIDSYQFSVLFFALLAAKKSIVLPQNGQPEQLAQCLVQAEAFTGVADNTCADVAFNKYIRVENMVNTAIEVDVNAAIRFFTSGSSGQPKAIDKTFSQLLFEVKELEQQFAEQMQQAMMVATVSHQHIYGLLFKVLWPLYSGRDVCFSSFDYPEHLLHFINQQSDAHDFVVISSPAYYHRLVQDNVLVAIKHKIHCLFSSGGPLKPAAAMQLASQLGNAPIEVLGSTETGGIAWRNQSTHSHWRAFSAIKLKLDELQRLIISSPYVDNGQWYQTDDCVQLLTNNQFNLLGRADRIVKIEEKRCSLDEISLRANQSDWVIDSYVFLLQHHESDGKRDEIAAVLVLTEQGEQALEQLGKFKFSQALKTHLKAFFEPLVIPRKYRYLNELPYNSQGKLNKAQLEKLFD